MWMQEDLSRKQPWDHYHTLQRSKPTTTSYSTHENCKRKLKTESRTHHMKGRLTCQSGRLTGPVGRPAGPLQSPFALRRLVCVSKICTVSFKSIYPTVIKGVDVDRWHGNALPPTPSPLYKEPSTPSRRPSSHREPSLIQIKIHHKREISTAFKM